MAQTIKVPANSEPTIVFMEELTDYTLPEIEMSTVSTDEKGEEKGEIRKVTPKGDPKLFQVEFDPKTMAMAPSIGESGVVLLAIVGVALETFDPVSFETAKDIREGDLLLVHANLDNPVFKHWTPPDEYKIPEDWGEHTLLVVKIIPDAEGKPIIIAASSE